MKRKSMSRGQSKSLFRRTASKVNSRNYRTVARGGYRL